jgi:hypothetical protein
MINSLALLASNWTYWYSHCCAAVGTSVSRQTTQNAQELLTLCVHLEMFMLWERSERVSMFWNLRCVSCARSSCQASVWSIGGVIICGKKTRSTQKMCAQNIRCTQNKVCTEHKVYTESKLCTEYKVYTENKVYAKNKVCTENVYTENKVCTEYKVCTEN